MAKFADRKGQEWAVEVTVGDLKPLREEYGIDLGDALKETMDTLAPWLERPEKVVELLWYFCREQAGGRGVEPEQFGKLFHRQAVQDGALAFVGAVLDFSLGPKAAAEMADNLRAEMVGADERGAGLIVRAFEQARSRNSAGNSPGPAGVPTRPPAA